MSSKVTDGGSSIVQLSTYFQNMLFNLKVHSLASFSNNLLEISFKKIGVSFS